MAEVCVNGHIRTEENTRFHKRGRGDSLKRVCLDCRRGQTTDRPAAHEAQAQRTTELHEDIEDLIRFGATFSEIIERGGFSSWAALRASLRRRGRDDLLEKLQKRLAASPKTKLSVPFKRAPYCGLRSCSRKHYAKKRCKPHYMQQRRGVKQPNRTHCKLPDCGGKHRSLGYCEKHYKQHRKGTLDTHTGD